MKEITKMVKMITVGGSRPFNIMKSMIGGDDSLTDL